MPAKPENRAIDDNARPRARSKAKVGLTVREGQAMRKKHRQLEDRIAVLETKISRWSDGLSEKQFVDTLIATIAAMSTNKLPRKKMVIDFVKAAIETRDLCREAIDARVEETVT